MHRSKLVGVVKFVGVYTIDLFDSINVYAGDLCDFVITEAAKQSSGGMTEKILKRLVT
ncbi:hypothetical protein Hanom_Chr01g00046961 [Helianthus anomalus]